MSVHMSDKSNYPFLQLNKILNAVFDANGDQNKRPSTEWTEAKTEGGAQQSSAVEEREVAEKRTINTPAALMCHSGTSHIRFHIFLFLPHYARLESLCCFAPSSLL